MSSISSLRLKFKPLATRLKQIVNTSSQLAPYVPLLKENQDAKIRRLNQDAADLQLVKKTKKQYQYLSLIENSTKIESKQNDFISNKSECIDPCETKMIIWYLLVFLAILYWFIETGIVIAFAEVAFEAELQSPSWLLVSCIFMLILLLDIFVQLRVGFLNKGIIVKNKQRVTARYVNYPIIIDISVLLILFLALATQLYAINYVKIIVILKFIRMFQMDRYVMRMLLIEYNLKVIYVILKQVFVIAVISHVIGILYYMLDSHLLTRDVCLNNPKFCWLNNAIAYSPISQLDWPVQYFYSFYWGVNTVTNISYGDLAPQNPYQTVYCLICFVLSLVLIAYIINQIVGVILKNIHAKENYRQHLVIFTTFMDLLGIDTEEQDQTKQILHQRYINRERIVIDQELMYKLPVGIKNEYFQMAYNKMYHSVEFILQEKADLVKIMCSLKEVKYSPDQYLFIQGASLNGLYYLSKGTVKLTCQLKDRQYQLTTIEYQTRSFLYCYQFFTKDRASYTTITVTKSLLYFLPKTIFEEAARETQKMTQILCLLAYQLKYANRLDRVLESCFLCGYQHRWNECNIKFLDKKQLKKNLKQDSKEKSEGFRRIKPKHRIWRDKRNLQELKRIVKKHKDPVLMALQRRVMEIRKKLLSARETLEVDRLYEWSIYLQEDNISLVRQKYNGFKKKRSLI